jgi:hypothetical protein
MNSAKNIRYPPKASNRRNAGKLFAFWRLALQGTFHIASPMEDPDDQQGLGRLLIKYYVTAERERAYSRSEFVTLATQFWVLRQFSHLFMQLIYETVSRSLAVVRDVGPNLEQVCARAWGKVQPRHLFGACRMLTAPGGALDLAGFECRGWAALDAFSNVVAKSLEFEVAQLIFQFEQAERLTHHFTGGAVGTRGDLLPNHFLESRGKADIHRQGDTSHFLKLRIGLMAKIVNLWHSVRVYSDHFRDQKGEVSLRQEAARIDKKTAVEGFRARVIPPTAGQVPAFAGTKFVRSGGPNSSRFASGEASHNTGCHREISANEQ